MECEIQVKLYVWHDALSDNTSGVMFAMATSVDQARALVLAQIKDEWERLSVVRELVHEPAVYDAPAGFFVFGGG